MRFASPEWFFLVPALCIAGWRWRGWRLHEPLRAIALAALLLALAEPQLQLTSAGLDLWVLTDRSESAAAAMNAQSREWEAILEKSRGRDDRIMLVDYAGEAVRRERGDPIFEGQLHRTRLGVALDYTVAQLEAGRGARLLAITDGYATEPLGAAAEKLLATGVALDYRLLADSGAADWRVAGLGVPVRVLPGEAFLVDFTVLGAGDAEVPWEVARNGRVAASGTAVVRGGTGRVRLTDRLGGGGAVRYEVRLKPPRDAHPENNTAAAWVEVQGGPRVVLVTAYPDDPLAPLLGAQGLAVDLVTAPAGLDAARLTGARLVILNNVPAAQVPVPFLAALKFFVTEQGGGLLMVGGRNSFGSGGYFASAIDPLLPVSMELKKEHRKLAVAMAIVMDRSGSMGMSVGGAGTKMDLANSGAARAVELLGDLDAISVHAVDILPHQVVGLAQVGPNRAAIINTVRRITSGGGGIVVHQGLRAGAAELAKAQTGTRHLILFADANDSRQQLGDFDVAADELRQDGATISVIGLGSPADRDADILQDVARRGGGRMFFNADANDLPAVFAQETVSVARSAFIAEPTGVEGLSGWSEIAARPPDWLKTIDGFNLSYLRPEASAALITTDEYAAPLVAMWTRGAGRVGAVSFPLGGPNSESVRRWPGYGDFVQTLARWLQGDDAPAGLALRAVVDGERLALDLLYDETWAGRLAQAAPVATLAEGDRQTGSGSERPLVWEKIEPGRFRAAADLTPGRFVRGAVRLGQTTLPFGPVTVAGSAEWAFERTRLEELKALSARSGGRERLDLAEIWKAPRAAMWRGVQGWLLATWLVSLLADAALSRLGHSLLPTRWRGAE